MLEKMKKKALDILLAVCLLIFMAAATVSTGPFMFQENTQSLW